MFIEELQNIKISRNKNDISSNQLDVSEDVAKDINNVVGQQGSPLEPSTREFMESRLGYNFGNVRIHTDKIASTSAQSVNARAYTVANHIVIGEEQYSPNTEDGKKLLRNFIDFYKGKEVTCTSI